MRPAITDILTTVDARLLDSTRIDLLVGQDTSESYLEAILVIPGWQGEVWRLEPYQYEQQHALKSGDT